MTESERVTVLALALAELADLLAEAIKRIEELERKNN